MTRSSRRWTRAGGIGLIVLVLAYAGLHWWVSAQVAAGFAAWRQAQAARGWNVSGEPPATSLRPFQPGIRVRSVAVSGPGWRWATDELDVAIPLWSPTRVRLTPGRHQTVEFGGATTTVDAGSMRVDVALPEGRDPALTAADLTVNTRYGTIALAAATFAQITATGRIAVGLNGLHLPPGYPYVLGPTVESAALDARIAPSLDSLRMPDLAAWRDGGGTVQLVSSRLQWGSLTAEATGTASLDRALQPLADLRVMLAGADESLATAVAQGVVQPRAALAIRAVLALLSRAQPAAGGPPGALPITLADGVVSLSGFPVERLPPVAWSR